MAETTTKGKGETEAENLTKEAPRQRNVDPIAERDRISFPLGQPIASDKEDPYRNQVRPLDPDGTLIVSGSVLHRVGDPIEVLPGDPIPAAAVTSKADTEAAEAAEKERHERVAALAKEQRAADEKRGAEAKAKTS